MSVKNLKVSVDYKLIKKIVAQNLGTSAAVLSIHRVNGGLFNTSYKVMLNGRTPVVLRIAPPEDKKLLSLEKHLLRREIAICEKIESFGVPVPALLSYDFSGKIIDRDYAIFEYKSGKNFYYHQKYLQAENLARIYGEMGNYAKIIHGIENEDGWFGYTQPFSPYGKWSDFIRQYVNSLQNDMKDHSYIVLPEDINLKAIIDRMTPLLDEVKIPRLIHGDLWIRNILIQKEQGKYTISAILDWDRNLRGDPYFEWILYGAELPEAFWQAYGTQKPQQGSPEYLRSLLYRACGGLQAALEESIHFGAKKKSLEMLGYSINDFRELINLNLRS